MPVTSSPAAARLLDRGGALAQADHDVDPGVLEVQRMGMTLRAVAEDRDGLAVEEGEVCVVVVVHARGRLLKRIGARGGATRPRPARPAARGRSGRGGRARRRARRSAAMVKKTSGSERSSASLSSRSTTGTTSVSPSSLEPAEALAADLQRRRPVPGALLHAGEVGPDRYDVRPARHGAEATCSSANPATTQRLQDDPDGAGGLGRAPAGDREHDAADHPGDVDGDDRAHRGGARAAAHQRHERGEGDEHDAGGRAARRRAGRAGRSSGPAAAR